MRIIIAWGFAAGAGVYDVPRALPWALIKRPFRAEELPNTQCSSFLRWVVLPLLTSRKAPGSNKMALKGVKTPITSLDGAILIEPV